MAASTYALAPEEVLGALRIGMMRAEIQAMLGPPSSTFRRSESSPSETDCYDATGAYVIYGPNGRCEAIEVAAPANVDLNGLLLVGSPFSDALMKLRSLAPDVEVDDTGAIAFSLGIGVYAPSALSDPAGPVESAIVFRDGYFG